MDDTTFERLLAEVSDFFHKRFPELADNIQEACINAVLRGAGSFTSKNNLRNYISRAIKRDCIKARLKSDRWHTRLEDYSRVNLDRLPDYSETYGNKETISNVLAGKLTVSAASKDLNVSAYTIRKLMGELK